VRRDRKIINFSTRLMLSNILKYEIIYEMAVMAYCVEIFFSFIRKFRNSR